MDRAERWWDTVEASSAPGASVVRARCTGVGHHVRRRGAVPRRPGEAAEPAAPTELLSQRDLGALDHRDLDLRPVLRTVGRGRRRPFLGARSSSSRARQGYAGLSSRARQGYAGLSSRASRAATWSARSGEPGWSPRIAAATTRRSGSGQPRSRARGSDPRGLTEREGGLVFGPIPDARRAFAAAAKAAGVERVWLHLMRHVGATATGRAGASLADLMAFGGWASPRMANRYSHSDHRRQRGSRTVGRQRGRNPGGRRARAAKSPSMASRAS
ncbi:tyrosine-type recombinase/integrase [Anaeromyxobacter sp. K]|uniref:tyrosine-type recombinase/integrase n=1 Tax=Anaeromyxobacter sp. (strain K) TaxID=447217 RepID=UPI0035106C71